ncbi:MAG: hypothetical protein CMJ58_18015 [Planctomycetaceae bacterium]|nr:hypothetical protein [Planctomycetaceae bacterium]
METNKNTRIQDHFIREVQVNYRSTQQTKRSVREKDDVADFVREVLVDNSREHFVALYLDAVHQVSCYSIISTGTANRCLAEPREIFQRAIVAGAVAVIVAHNHPSGDLTASDADVRVTERLRKAGECLGIPVLDHVIVTDDDSVSVTVF